MTDYLTSLGIFTETASAKARSKADCIEMFHAIETHRKLDEAMALVHDAGKGFAPTNS